MTKKKNVFKSLKPLEKAQYIGVLRTLSISKGDYIINIISPLRGIHKTLGLSVDKLKQVINILADSAFLEIKNEGRSILIKITDAGREIISEEK